MLRYAVTKPRPDGVFNVLHQSSNWIQDYYSYWEARNITSSCSHWISKAVYLKHVMRRKQHRLINTVEKWLFLHCNCIFIQLISLFLPPLRLLTPTWWTTILPEAQGCRSVSSCLTHTGYSQKCPHTHTHTPTRAHNKHTTNCPCRVDVSHICFLDTSSSPSC